MKMKELKRKALGVTMSIVVLAGQTMPVLADTDIGGTGNVLDYAVEKVVTPTSLKIALNPNQYAITTKYVKTSDTALANGKTYYTLSNGTYTAVASPVVGNIGTYYEAITSSSQIVSLNYGIVNKSTGAKDVTVDVKASYTATDNKTAIEFVDSKNKAEAKSASNTAGAEKDELKMYLALASAATPSGNAAAVTADTYAKATEYDEDTTYYTKSETNGVVTYTETDVDDEDAFTAGTYFVETTVIGPEITGAQLSDVTMTAATGDSVKAFVPGTDDKAKATIAYKLGEASYTVKAGEIIDFSTTQAQLANKLEMSALGGIAAFTITGAINPNADWTKADTATIKFTPVYTVEETTDTETAVAGGYNQVTLAAKTYTVTYNGNYGDTPATATEPVTVGSNPSGPATAFTREGYTFAGWMDAATNGNDVELSDVSSATTLYAKWTENNVVPSITLASVTAAEDTDAVWTYNLGSGTQKATAISSITYNGADATSAFVLTTAGQIILDKSTVNSLLTSSGSYSYVVTFNNEANTTGTITLVVE